jgi:hypothetical protein
MSLFCDIGRERVTGALLTLSFMVKQAHEGVSLTDCELARCKSYFIRDAMVSTPVTNASGSVSRGSGFQRTIFHLVTGRVVNGFLQVLRLSSTPE